MDVAGINLLFDELANVWSFTWHNVQLWLVLTMSFFKKFELHDFDLFMGFERILIKWMFIFTYA